MSDNLRDRRAVFFDIHTPLANFMSLFSFYTPGNTRKSEVLMFSGGKER